MLPVSGRPCGWEDVFHLRVLIEISSEGLGNLCKRTTAGSFVLHCEGLDPCRINGMTLCDDSWHTEMLLVHDHPFLTM